VPPNARPTGTVVLPSKCRCEKGNVASAGRNQAMSVEPDLPLGAIAMSA
jgi:hypothetical protein